MSRLMRDSVRPMFDAEELKALKEKISNGFLAENILREFSTILDAMENSLLEQFATPSAAYYQNIDNSPLLVLHLKARVIRELKQTLAVRAETGRTALSEKAALEAQGAKFDE